MLELTEKRPQLQRLIVLNPSCPEVARQWILATNPWAKQAYDEQAGTGDAEQAAGAEQAAPSDAEAEQAAEAGNSDETAHETAHAGDPEGADGGPSTAAMAPIGLPDDAEEGSAGSMPEESGPPSGSDDTAPAPAVVPPSAPSVQSAPPSAPAEPEEASVWGDFPDEALWGTADSSAPPPAADGPGASVPGATNGVRVSQDASVVPLGPATGGAAAGGASAAGGAAAGGAAVPTGAGPAGGSPTGTAPGSPAGEPGERGAKAAGAAGAAGVYGYSASPPGAQPSGTQPAGAHSTAEHPPVAPPPGGDDGSDDTGRSRRRAWFACGGCLILVLILLVVAALVGRAWFGGDDETYQRDSTTAAETTEEETTPEKTPTTEPDPVSPAPDDATELTKLQSPSGNISCTLEEDSASCSLVDRDYSGAGLEDCDSGPFSITVAGKESELDCGQSYLHENATTLEYDLSAKHGDMACTSRFDGMTCWNVMTGHGFMVNRATYETF
nr:hypothetical protein [Brachybacterium fresconis]